MKRIFIVLSLLSSFLFGDILNQKIENLIGKTNSIKHKNLISNLTKNKSRFYYNSKLNYTNILNMLHSNGLLKLRYDKPQEVTIDFKINSNSIIAMKILKDTLKNIGYSYYFTDYLRYNKNILDWKIIFKSESMLDPYIFNQELLKNGVRINKISRLSNTSWVYDFNLLNAKLAEAIKIEKNEKVKFLKPLKPYLIQVDNAKEITVISRKLNHWFPSLKLYTKNLYVVGMIKKSRVYRGIKLKLPKDTYYIMIDDSYTLLNIKRGLTIIVK